MAKLLGFLLLLLLIRAGWDQPFKPRYEQLQASVVAPLQARYQQWRQKAPAPESQPEAAPTPVPAIPATTSTSS